MTAAGTDGGSSWRDHWAAAAATFAATVASVQDQLPERCVKDQLLDHLASASVTARDQLTVASGTAQDQLVAASVSAQGQIKAASISAQDQWIAAATSAATARDQLAAVSVRDQLAAVSATAHDQLATASVSAKDQWATAAATAVSVQEQVTAADQRLQEQIVAARGQLAAASDTARYTRDGLAADFFIARRELVAAATKPYACQTATISDSSEFRYLPVDSVAIDKVSKALHDDMADFRGMHPAFDDGSMVEYYSPTHKIWLVGTIHLAVEKTTKWSGAPVFVYNVRLKKSGQTRTTVPLDMLREPFQPTDLVEVFSKRNTGQWMLAAVRGPRAGGNIVRGYKVAVEEQSGVPEMLLDNVPSWRMRRRFPPRSSVEVYRGPMKGWCRGVVHSVISAFPAEPPVPLSPFSPGTSADAEEQPAASDLPGARPKPTADSTTDWIREDALTMCGSTVVGEEGMSVHPWVQVPVYVEEWDEEEYGRDPDMERCQWVPSYLIRMHMIKLASSKQYERRSFIL